MDWSFFFSIFFFFPRKNQGTTALCILNRGVWRERETGYLPPRARAGCDAFTRAESVRLYAFISLECIDRSSGFGGEKKTFEAKQQQRSVTRAGGQNFGSLLRHFEAFFFHERERELFSITDQNFVYIFVNSTGWSRCRR